MYTKIFSVSNLSKQFVFGEFICFGAVLYSNCVIKLKCLCMDLVKAKPPHERKWKVFNWMRDIVIERDYKREWEDYQLAAAGIRSTLLLIEGMLYESSSTGYVIFYDEYLFYLIPLYTFILVSFFLLFDFSA